MKYKWLQNKQLNKLIIFFNGWGMDDFIVSNLDCEDYDVIVFYDYNDLDIDIDLGHYEEKHVIAWSMGVMVATLFDFGNVMSATAICGTPKPIDDKYGIPERIYNLTIKGFSQNSVQTFMKRMFLDAPNTEKFSNRTLDSQKTELIKLLEYNSKAEFEYSRVIIADNDKIIPTKNQLNYWLNPEMIRSGHCHFGLYKSWAELL